MLKAPKNNVKGCLWHSAALSVWKATAHGEGCSGKEGDGEGCGETEGDGEREARHGEACLESAACSSNRSQWINTARCLCCGVGVWRLR